jgi:hypothetical protein
MMYACFSAGVSHESSMVGREPRKLDGRDFGQADLLRSLEPRVPGYDAILAIDQDRVRESEGLDAAGDQGNFAQACGS